MKYEELEKSYVILEQKLVSLQLQPPEQVNDNHIRRLSKETASNGRDIIEQYKKMISQLQEQKKVSDERIEQLTTQIYSEKKENPGQSQKRSLQRTPLSNPINPRGMIGSLYMKLVTYFAIIIILLTINR
jgi:hypothetical protein